MAIKFLSRIFRPNVREQLGISGHIRLEIHNADGSLAAVREVDNTVCVNGKTLLAQAINWSGIEDQNASMGNPFSQTFFAPIYGAIGTGSPSPVDTDTQLLTEVNRAVVSGAATSPASHGNGAQWTWQFFFGLPASNISITEVGIFGQATSAANSGQLLNHATITAVSQTTVQTAILSVTFTLG